MSNSFIKTSSSKEFRGKFRRHSSHPLLIIQSHIFQSVQRVLGVPVEELQRMITITPPPPEIKGDFSFSTFGLAKRFRKDAVQLASQINEQLQSNVPTLVKEVSVIGPYINFELSQSEFSKKTLSHIKKTGRHYGRERHSGVALVHCAIPHITQPVTVDYLRPLIIGCAIENFYENQGYRVIRYQYLNDWDVRTGELLLALKMWKNTIGNSDILEQIYNLYRQLIQHTEKDPGIRAKAKVLFRELDQGNQKLLRLWTRYRNAMIKSLQEVYKQFGISCNEHQSESTLLAGGADTVIQEYCSSNSVSAANNVILVNLLGALPPALLQRQDKSKTSLARRLADLKYFLDSYKPDIVLYVTKDEEGVAIQQLLSLGKKTYLPPLTKADYLLIGNTLFEADSTDSIKVYNVIDRLQSLLKNKLNKSETRQAVATAMVLYEILRQPVTKNISIDSSALTSNQSNTFLYLREAFILILEILKTDNAFSDKDLDKENFKIIKELALFPEILRAAVASREPHRICLYLENITQLSMDYLKNHKGSSVDNNLLASVATTLKNGFSLLNSKLSEGLQ